jgi:hypothetical protein
MGHTLSHRLLGLRIVCPGNASGKRGTVASTSGILHPCLIFVIVDFPYEDSVRKYFFPGSGKHLPT